MTNRTISFIRSDAEEVRMWALSAAVPGLPHPHWNAPSSKKISAVIWDSCKGLFVTNVRFIQFSNWTQQRIISSSLCSSNPTHRHVAVEQQRLLESPPCTGQFVPQLGKKRAYEQSLLFKSHRTCKNFIVISQYLAGSGRVTLPQLSTAVLIHGMCWTNGIF